MIHRVWSSHSSFKEVRLLPGLNVVLADRAKGSSEKDTRNGVGKSLLIEVIHFCLGSEGKRLRVPPLAGWSFFVELDVAGRRLVVERAVDSPRFVRVAGDTVGLALQPRADGRTGEPCYELRDWIALLGASLFGLGLDAEGPYRPAFRSLISYFARRGKDAYASPFQHFGRQHEWDKQVNNAFLLGLSWEDAKDFQILKDQKNLLDNLKNASKAGLIRDVLGSVGELEAERLRLESAVRKGSEQLASFRVHPQYREFEQNVNALTRAIHELANVNVFDAELLSAYRASIEDASGPDAFAVVRMYEAAQIEVSDMVKRRLTEVQQFHSELVANRREFLRSEIERLERDIAARDSRIANATTQRADLLQILRSHKALDEYSRLQEMHAKAVSSLADVTSRIENLRKFESGQNALRIEQATLEQRARLDYEARAAIRAKAISLFNQNSEALYDAPGNLILDVGSRGLHLDVEILRSGSAGIESMKVFCYDMMLAQLWSARAPSPGFLIHDSLIFDGVDERQTALALQLAAAEASRRTFQYICTLNSDRVPRDRFEPGFDFEQYVRLVLTDADASGGLLGMRF